MQQIKGIEKDTDYNIEHEQKQYKHLNIKERVMIETIMKEQLEVYGKVNITSIAKKLNRSKSIISRKIKRNIRNNNIFLPSWSII